MSDKSEVISGPWPCYDFCNTQQYGPDGVWASQPCNCYNARIEELEKAIQAMHPDKAPGDNPSVVMYFHNEKDRQEFIDGFRAANPGVVAHSTNLPRTKARE